MGRNLSISIQVFRVLLYHSVVSLNGFAAQDVALSIFVTLTLFVITVGFLLYIATIPRLTAFGTTFGVRRGEWFAL